MQTRRYCLHHELKNDDKLIALYESYHKQSNIWPEIIDSIRSAGIVDMSIYRSGINLTMIMEVNAAFDFEAKAHADLNNPKVQEWEALMDTFQDTKPGTGQKWKLMKNIFQLESHTDQKFQYSYVY